MTDEFVLQEINDYIKNKNTIGIYILITSYIRMRDSVWLIAVIFFLQCQALHCEFADCLLHVGVFAKDLTFFHGICKIVFAVFTLHRDAFNQIC